MDTRQSVEKDMGGGCVVVDSQTQCELDDVVCSIPRPFGSPKASAQKSNSTAGPVRSIDWISLDFESTNAK